MGVAKSVTFVKTYRLKNYKYYSPESLKSHMERDVWFIQYDSKLLSSIYNKDFIPHYLNDDG